MSSFKRGILPTSSISSFDGNSTNSDNGEEIYKQVEHEPSPVDSKDVVPGGTIPDVYALIKRTLNLGMPTKPKTTPSSSITEMCNAACDSQLSSNEPQPRDIQGVSTDDDTTGPVPEHKTASLHELHTTWLPDDHVNVEVLLGLKEKNSRESTLDNENQSTDSLPSDATEQQQVVKMDDVATDSGIASNAASTNPSEMTQL